MQISNDRFARWVFRSACVLALVVVAVLAYGSYPILNGSESSNPTVLAPPSQINIDRVSWASVAQNDPSFSWLIPTVYFLEDQAKAEIAAKTWRDCLPIIVETKEFSTPTKAFDLFLTTQPGMSAYGYAYRVNPSSDFDRYIPLKSIVSNQGDTRVTRVSVPECESGDSLAFVLLISSKNEFPNQPNELARSIQITIGETATNQRTTLVSTRQ